MNLADAFEQIADGAAARGGLDGSELAAVLAETRRSRRRVTGTVVAGLTGAAAAGALALSLLPPGGTSLPPVAPTRTISPSPAPSSSADPTGTWPSAVTAAALPRCGSPAPVLDSPADPQLTLTVDPVDGVLPADQAVNPTATLHTTAPFYGEVSGAVTLAVVAREGEWAGKVVGLETSPEAQPPIGSGSAVGSLVNPGAVVMTSCIPGLRGRASENEIRQWEILPNGSYDLWEIVPLAATTLDGVAYGGPGTLLLAGGPQTLVIGDPMPTAAAAPALPACGQRTDGLTPTALGPITARTTWQRNLEATGFSAALNDRGPATFERVQLASLSWAIAQNGIVVHAGTLPRYGSGSVLAPQVEVYATDAVGLGGLTDCRTGAPLDESVPIEIWTRPVVQLDLTPALADDAAAEVSFVASPAWFTYQPTPVPTEVALVGEGAAPVDGVDLQNADQTGDRTWVVNQTWADGATWDRIKEGLTAAGYTLDEERTWRALDWDGINRLSGTFRSSRWTIVVTAGNETGGGWVSSWQVSTS